MGTFCEQCNGYISIMVIELWLTHEACLDKVWMFLFVAGTDDTFLSKGFVYSLDCLYLDDLDGIHRSS